MLELREVGTRQRKMELLCLRVDTSDVSTSAWATDGLDEGTFHATIKKTATGTYSIKPNRPGLRACFVVGASPVTVDLRFSAAVPSASEVIIVWEGGGTDTDTDFDVTLAVFYDAQQR